ncbi:MAG: MerR family transcriptional regulator [Rhodoglobus sp.]
MKIGELATLTGVSVRSLRYYEQQGLLAPERTSAGHRVFTAQHEDSVAHIRELLEAGFCSSVIRLLLPAFTDPHGDEALLRSSFDAADARLRSEIASIETELSALSRLRDRLRLAPDMHVMPEDAGHEPLPTSPTAAVDHRDRRLR